MELGFQINSSEPLVIRAPGIHKQAAIISIDLARLCLNSMIARDPVFQRDVDVSPKYKRVRGKQRVIYKMSLCDWMAEHILRGIVWGKLLHWATNYRKLRTAMISKLWKAHWEKRSLVNNILGCQMWQRPEEGQWVHCAERLDKYNKIEKNNDKKDMKWSINIHNRGAKEIMSRFSEGHFGQNKKKQARSPFKFVGFTSAMITDRNMPDSVQFSKRQESDTACGNELLCSHS